MNKNIIISSSLIFIAQIFFASNDAVINYLSPRGIEFYHFIFYGTPAFLSVPLYLFIRGELKSKIIATNYFIPIIRSILFLPIPFFTFVSLKHITLPEFTTLNMSSPIFAVIISIFILKEKLNNLIILSLVFGILGVYFVIQPGFENFNPFFLLVLLCAFFITISGMIVNKYNKITSAIGFFIYGGIFTHIFSIILFIFDPLLIDLQTFILITFSSIVINIAICFVTIAFYRSSRFYGSLNCLVYFQIFWSVIFGIVFFNEQLNLFAAIGALFIIISGLISMPAQYKQLKQ